MADSPAQKVTREAPGAGVPPQGQDVAARGGETRAAGLVPASAWTAPFAGLWLTHAAASLDVDAAVLERLVELAGELGIACDMARFSLDLAYAYRLLAQVHSSDDEQARPLVLILFDACQRAELRRRGCVFRASMH